MGMRKFLIFLLVMAGGLVWGAEKAADKPAHPKLHAAINAHLKANGQNYFGAAGFKAIAPTEYRAELGDLNSDGVSEAIVLMLGRHWGGTGGPMSLFRGNQNGFVWLGRMTCVQAPMEGSVCVAKTKTKGWRDLAVRVRGRGVRQKYVVMKFDGARYLLNPTVQQVMADWPAGEFVLISGDGTAKVEKNPDAIGASFNRWTSEESAIVRYFSPDLISVRGQHYEYTGGAHGNGGDFPVNYWWRNARASEVTLADLFAPKKNWKSIVGGHIRRELKKNGASWPPKNDEDAVVEQFTFSPVGVEFHFAPYAVGSYAEGSYHVLVPFTVLRPVLRTDGPLACWAK